MLTGWPFGIDSHEAEEARDCRGLVEEEPALRVEGEEEEEGDLRGASSAVGEEVEVGGADMFAPSPGKSTWAVTSASRGLQNGPVWIHVFCLYGNVSVWCHTDFVEMFTFFILFLF